MKFFYFLKTKVDNKVKDDFEAGLLADNIQRGRPLAWFVIGIEILYAMITAVTWLLKADDRFPYPVYLFMYGFMIALNAAFLLLTSSFRDQSAVPKGKVKALKRLLIVYIALIMCWGSAVSLIDQRLYGHVMSFMVNMITCSVIFLMDNRQIMTAYAISVLPLMAGLPLVQKSGDILVGHYANLAVFLIISWLASRLMYRNYYDNYMSKVLIQKSHALLEREIAENRRINAELAFANNRLKRTALLDELTGIPNRRSFREYIDRTFPDEENRAGSLSILMIDIDSFKQYNDHYGHEEGDKILVAVANQINSRIKTTSEFAVRWGGEEFIYAALNKSPEEIMATAEAIRTGVQSLSIPHERSDWAYVTVSIGICTLPMTKKNDVAEAIRRADGAMYRAKDSGRNCIREDSEAGALQVRS